MNERKQIATTLAAVIAVTLAAVAVGYWLSVVGLTPDDVALYIDELGVWGHLGIIAMMIAHCFVPFPAEIVAIAAGVCYGVVWGTALVWIGAMAGAVLSFLLSRKLGRSFVNIVVPARHQDRLDRWTDEQGAATLLISRFIPVIAFNLINYAAGLTRVSWSTFLWTTAIGILPLTTLMVAMGAQMRSASSTTLIGLSFIGVAIMGLSHWFFHRRKSAKASQSRTEIH